MNIKAILLDMDGTVTKFNLDYMAARRRALETLAAFELKDDSMDEEMSVYLMLKAVKHKIPVERFKQVRAKLYGILEEMEIAAADRVALHPVARPTLQKLRRQGLKMAIVTNNSRLGTQRTLKKHNLARYFDAVVTRDDSEEIKPDAGAIKLAIRLLRAKRDETLYVGDGVIDVTAARKAKVLVATVPTGPVGQKSLVEAGSDFLLDSIEELPELVSLLNKEADYVSADTKKLTPK